MFIQAILPKQFIQLAKRVQSNFMNKISQSNMLIIGMFCLGTSLLFAGGNSDGTISWGFLTISLFGGLSLFLYGMAKMSEGMKKAAGNKMRNILAVLTKNRVIALIVGAFVTMVIQSSSATTVMLVSFVQAELMTYAQSIGIILGANIGTTVTAQLVAFKLTDYALLMITVGFAMTMFGKKRIGKTYWGSNSRIWNSIFWNENYVRCHETITIIPTLY